MKWVITFESKFNIGDSVEYNDNITIPFKSKVLDIKLTESFKILYKLENKGVLYSDMYLKLIESNGE